MGIKASQTKNLLIDNPQLCEEWDYKKNKLSPKEYTPLIRKSCLVDMQKQT